MPFRPDLGNVDLSRIPDDQWEFEGISADGTARTFIHWLDRENGIFARKKENLVERDLVDLNQEQYNESLTKRFGDGQSVARIPLNVFYRDFPKHLKEGDKDFTKWWLNREENRPYRNFRGKI